ncbi:HutD/Ves family protein [Streptomyces mexicanus]|uniref:HutD/Ves family protein n=1 Tax=Streptomyces mexicanus TaxID=178566 RepID=UPI001F1AA52D|nr:HutD family protein [Streptomyces mexicanus]
MISASRVLRAGDRTVTPWKNGGGVTREVAAGPDGAGLDDFTWRVSLAEVARGGPFSAFPGVDRIITVVDGPGMELTVDGTPHTLAAPYRPFAFPGDAETTCRLLGGPLVDLNVMTRRTRATAHVRIVREGFHLDPRPTEQVVLIALAGTVTPAEPGVTLGRLDAAVLCDRDAGAVRVEGVAAVVTVTVTAPPAPPAPAVPSGG